MIVRILGLMMAAATVVAPSMIAAQEAVEAAPGISSLQDLTSLEISNMRQAQDTAFIDTGFYHTLENLDDLDYETNNILHDWINYNGGTVVVDVSTGLFQPTLENLLDLPNRWLGPYINGYHSTRVTTDNSNYDLGTPLDFWGSPYLFFSPLGLLRPNTRTVTLEYYGDSFDRYAIVSLGPDRVMSTDDVIQTFGLAPTKTVISSVSLFSDPTSGTLMQIRGYNFGPDENQSQVKINGDPKNNIIYWWSPNLVYLDLLADQIPQVGTVQIVAPGNQSSQAYSYALPPFLNAYDWELYR